MYYLYCVCRITDKYLDNDKDNTYQITIKLQSDVMKWKDAMQSFRRPYESKHLHITFLGEPAVDEGGGGGQRGNSLSCL